MNRRPGVRIWYGLWLVLAMFTSLRAAFWSHLEGHESLQVLAVGLAVVLAYLCGFASGRRPDKDQQGSPRDNNPDELPPD
ncbi:hypothetical protein [Streptomyces sp. 061-3]|uniref:hypothetical protein n=1 Tax=Streptomyces sp. 061-3 TaxID=2789268 RepID=UPI00397F78C5